MRVGHLVKLIIACIIFALGIPGCNQVPTQPEPAPPSSLPGNTQTKPLVSQPQVFTVSSAPSSNFKVDLFIIGTPKLGEQVQVKAAFALNELLKGTSENSTAEIILPGEFELVSGNLTWRGDIVAGNKYEISTIIRAVKSGDNLKIEARVVRIIGPQYVSVGAAILYAHVFQDRAVLSETLTGPEGIGTGKPTTPPEGWKPPPGYEDDVPITPSPPPDKEPPGQDVPPAKAP